MCLFKSAIASLVLCFDSAYSILSLEFFLSSFFTSTVRRWMMPSFYFTSSSSKCALLLVGKNSSDVVVYSWLLLLAFFLKKANKVRWLVLFAGNFDVLVTSSLPMIVAFFFLWVSRLVFFSFCSGLGDSSVCESELGNIWTKTKTQNNNIKGVFGSLGVFI